MAFNPPDPFQSFQVGQQLAGQGGLNVAINQLTERMNQYNAQRMRGVGAEAERLGQMRAIASPEGQQYMQTMRGMQGGLFNNTQSVGNQTTPGTAGVGGVTTGGTPPFSTGGANSYSPEYGVTGETIDPLNPEATKYTIGETPGSQMKRAIATKTGEESASQQNLAMAAYNSLSNVVSNFKAMREVSGGTGRIRGIGNQISGFMGEQAPMAGLPVNQYVQSLNSSTTEAATALAKIAAPSAKIGPDMINQFKAILVSPGSTDQELDAKIRAAVHQAAGRSYASQGQIYGPQERATYDQMVNQILQTPSARQQGTAPFQNRTGTAPFQPGGSQSGLSQEQRNAYNQARAQGMSPEEAKRRVGIQ